MVCCHGALARHCRAPATAAACLALLAALSTTLPPAHAAAATTSDVTAAGDLLSQILAGQQVGTHYTTYPVPRCGPAAGARLGCSVTDIVHGL